LPRWAVRNIFNSCYCVRALKHHLFCCWAVPGLAPARVVSACCLRLLRLAPQRGVYLQRVRARVVPSPYLPVVIAMVGMVLRSGITTPGSYALLFLATRAGHLLVALARTAWLTRCYTAQDHPNDARFFFVHRGSFVLPAAFGDAYAVCTSGSRFAVAAAAFLMQFGRCRSRGFALLSPLFICT